MAKLLITLSLFALVASVFSGGIDNDSPPESQDYSDSKKVEDLKVRAFRVLGEIEAVLREYEGKPFEWRIPLENQKEVIKTTIQEYANKLKKARDMGHIMKPQVYEDFTKRLNVIEATLSKAKGGAQMTKRHGKRPKKTTQ